MTVEEPVLLIRLLLLVFMLFVPVQAAADSPRDRFREGIERLAVDSGDYSFQYGDRLEVARKLSHDDHGELAVRIYEDLLEDHPGDPDALLGRGLTYGWEGNYERAVEDLERVVGTHPGYHEAWRALVNVYRWSGRRQTALEVHDRWIEHNPDDYRPYLSKARILASGDRYSEAIAAANRAEKLGAEPGPLGALRRRIHAQRRIGEGDWELTAGYDHTTLSRGRSDWRSGNLRITRNLDSGSIHLGTQRIERFNTWNTTLFTEAYVDLRARRYFHVRYLTSPQHDFTPRHDILAEVFQGFSVGWEGSIRYRRMNFKNTDVDIAGMGLTRYLGNWYVNGGVDWSRNNRSEEGFSQTLTFRHYYRGNADDYWEVSLGRGERPVSTSGATASRTVETQSFGLLWQRFWTDSWGSSMSYRYLEPDREPLRRTLSFAVTYRWHASRYRDSR